MENIKGLLKPDEIWKYPKSLDNTSLNFTTILTQKGKWRIEAEKKKIYVPGKTLVKINQNDYKIDVATEGDHNNFMSALLESHLRNDIFLFENGLTRCSSHGKEPLANFRNRINECRKILDYFEGKAMNLQTTLNLYAQ